MIERTHGYPEWIVVLAGRITAAVQSGEWGRVEVAELIRKTVTAAKVVNDTVTAQSSESKPATD